MIANVHCLACCLSRVFRLFLEELKYRISLFLDPEAYCCGLRGKPNVKSGVREMTYSQGHQRKFNLHSRKEIEMQKFIAIACLIALATAAPSATESTRYALLFKRSSAPDQAKCSQSEAPAKQTTILEQLYNSSEEDLKAKLDASFAAMDVNGDGYLSGQELSIYQFHNISTDDPTVQVGTSQLENWSDFDDNDRVSKTEFEKSVNTLAHMPMTGCAGLCSAVEDKLNSCSFFADAGNDQEKVLEQQQARFMLTSCKLGSPDFTMFGECVLNAQGSDAVHNCVHSVKQSSACSNTSKGECPMVDSGFYNQFAELAAIVEKASKTGHKNNNSTSNVSSSKTALDTNRASIVKSLMQVFIGLPIAFMALATGLLVGLLSWIPMGILSTFFGVFAIASFAVGVLASIIALVGGFNTVHTTGSISIVGPVTGSDVNAPTLKA